MHCSRARAQSLAMVLVLGLFAAVFANQFDNRSPFAEHDRVTVALRQNHALLIRPQPTTGELRPLAPLRNT